ncbi:MAG: class I SAM-dependent methyltransferase [Actinomycetota bacterium]
MSQFHFTPDDYLDLMHAEVPAYEELQERVATASEGLAVERILELGTGTGETSLRVLRRYPEARLTGIDVSEEMLAAADRFLPSDRVDALLVQGIEDRLPEGPFDLVISALAVHHLRGPDKADLFRRVAGTLRPGGRVVLGDVVEPADPADVVTSISPDYDFPSPVTDQLRWLKDAGFATEVVWSRRDLVVIRADL